MSMIYGAVAMKPMTTKAEMIAEYKSAHQRIIAAGISYEKRARLKLGALPRPSAQGAGTRCATLLPGTCLRQRRAIVCQQPVENLCTCGKATGCLWNGTHPDLSFVTPIPSFAMIIAAVAEVTDVPVRDMLGPWRYRRAVHARQVAIYLMRKIKNASFPQIGEKLGGRDHSTAMHSYRQVETNREKFEPTLKAVVARLDEQG